MQQRYLSHHVTVNLEISSLVTLSYAHKCSSGSFFILALVIHLIVLTSPIKIIQLLYHPQYFYLASINLLSFKY